MGFKKKSICDGYQPKHGNIGEPPKPSKSLLTVNVSVKDTETFKNILTVIGELVIDERIPEQIRAEYVNKVMASG